jgi:hypothetical protein
MTKLPIKVKLARPIPDGDAAISELVIDETDMAAEIAYQELRETFSDPPTPAQTMRALVFWTARMAAVSEDIIERIKVSDQPAVQAAVDAVFAHMGVDTADDDDGEPGKEPAAAA